MKLTQISKILAVFVTIASLAFVGFAVATTFGGPDWVAVAQDIDGYSFSKSDGPDAQWSATRARDAGNVGSSKVLPDLITKVLNEKAQQNQQRISELQSRLPLIEQRIAAQSQFEPVDVKALEEHQAWLLAQLTATREELQRVSADAIEATNESQKLEQQIVARREDVLRLEAQVDELRADLFRLEAIRRQLNDLVNQVEGDLARASDRDQQMKDRGLVLPNEYANLPEQPAENPQQ